MGGDEIVAEWLGDIASGRIVTSGTPQRFCASSKRFRQIKFQNFDFDDYSYLGKYYENDTAFLTDAFLMGPMAVVSFEYADLFELGCRESTGSASLKWIGVNEY